MLPVIAMVRGLYSEWWEVIAVVMTLALVFVGPVLWLGAIIVHTWAVISPKRMPKRLVVIATLLAVLMAGATAWVLICLGPEFDGAPVIAALWAAIGFGGLCVIGALVHHHRT